jgi:prepilin-type N-terminal cleavage/methylation domain-containing protein
MDSLYNRMARRRRKGQGGFTLIELLVVIAVLAVLAGIVIFNVVGVANRGKSSACATDIKTVQTASDAFFNDTGGYPVAITDLVPGYIHTAPTDLSGYNFNSDTKGTLTATCTL